MIYYSKESCGCCVATMVFNTEESIKTQFEQAGLTSSALITDDDGQIHNGIDTFYGYWIAEDENRGLDYLVKR